MAFIVLPLITVILPCRWGDSLIRLVARRGWLLRSRSNACLQSARNYLAIDDPESWKVRWRLVELMDARDGWYCFFGRSRSLVRQMDFEGLPAEPGLIFVGAHWGTGLAALAAFLRSGLQPRLVYREVKSDIFWSAPFQYVYLLVLVNCIRRICRGGAIRVPGGRSAFEAALRESGSPVIVLDAPALNSDNSLRATVLGQPAELNRNGFLLLAEYKARCVFFYCGIREKGRSSLVCSEPFEPRDAKHLVERYGEYLNDLLRLDSAQWRLWHVAPQFFKVDG